MSFFRKTLAKISITLLLVLVGVVLLQVTTRYLSRFELLDWIPLLPWTEELSRFLFIAIISFSAPLVMQEDGFARVEMISDKLKTKDNNFYQYYRICINIILMTFYFFFATGAFYFTKIGFKSTSPTLGIPFWYLYGLVFIMSLMMILELAITLFTDIKKALKIHKGSQ